jgi:hypothetical protein
MKKTNIWELSGTLDIKLGREDSYIDVGNESLLQILYDLDQKNVKIIIENKEG